MGKCKEEGDKEKENKRMGKTLQYFETKKRANSI